MEFVRLAKLDKCCYFSPKHPSRFLQHPGHLAVDPEGRVYVADQWNSRIIRLDSDLRFDHVIYSEGTDGLQGPFRLSIFCHSGC